jgi:isochorismate synthase
MSETSIEEGMARLAALAASGAARARAERRHVLISVVERLHDVDALAEAIAFTSSPAESHPPETRDASCMYWERASARFSLAGIGAARTLTATGRRRFTRIDEEWTELVDGALVDDPSGGAAGTGPTLLGGFSFEPSGPRTALWHGFESAQLMLPRFLVATAGDAHWLTTTIVVGPEGTLDVPLDRIAEARRRIGHAALSSRETRRDEPEGRIRYTDLRSASDWRALVASAVDVIREGALEKAVLARAVRVERGSGADAFDVGSVLRHLRAAHPDSFVFACWRAGRAFVGASPERLVRLDEREVVASSLAGSAERGATPKEDAWLAARLIASPKDAGEHAIVLRALRDALSELCDDVSSAAVPSLLTLRHVHHLHTVVRARLRAGGSLLELVGRLHPTPAVGGAPRGAALDFIRAHEQLDRGWYAAPVGWLQRDRGEFAVALRSGLVDGNSATLFAGCGVVHDSEPDLELAESVMKLRSMLAALAASEDVSDPATAMADEGVAR